MARLKAGSQYEEVIRKKVARGLLSEREAKQIISDYRRYKKGTLPDYTRGFSDLEPQCDRWGNHSIHSSQ